MHPEREEAPRRGRLHRLGAALRRASRTLARYFAVVFGRGVPWPRRTAYAAGGGAALLAGLLALVVLYTVVLIPFTPPTSDIRKTKSERAAVVYSADGERLVEFRPVNRQWVSLGDIAPEVTMALLATEDRRFYDHGGVDLRRLAGAALRTLRGDRQGASTITQQLARNLYPEQIGRRITLTRKLKELITTIKIERALSKDEILETYLNTVPFLYDAYGIELAARTYFGVPASDVDILQSATLVGMLKGTAFYNPVRHPDRSLERRNLVLRQMVVHGTLREDRYASIADSPLALRFERQPRMQSRAPHFTQYVRRWVSAWAQRNGYNMYRDSLVVHTTLDLRLQREAERSVDAWLPALQAVADYEWSRSDVRVAARSPAAYRGLTSANTRFAHLWNGRPELVSAFIRATPQFRRGLDAGHEPDALIDSLRADQAFMTALREVKTRLETGLVALHPGTGHILAWVGSHDFDEVPFDHVATARRQPGSTFKPIVYAAALERGWRWDDTLPDQEIEMQLAGGEVWRPTNVGGSTGRDMTLAAALAQSTNTVTAQLIADVGARRVARLARRMGVVHSRLDEVPSLALGTSEVSLLEMTAAYATLASGGVYHEPVAVARIEDRTGRTVYEAPTRGRRALPEETALRVVDMMRDVVDGGTGGRIRTTFGIREDVAGKTGTTQNNMDGWFIGMHPELVVGSWVGFDDPRITFRSNYWGAGGNNATLLVGEFYRRAFRHPETRLVGIRFPDLPDEDPGESLGDRIRGWLAGAADTVGELLVDGWEWVRDRLGDSDAPLAPTADPDDPVAASEPTAPITRDDASARAEADSLARAARDSMRMDEIMRRLEQDGLQRLEGRQPVDLAPEPEPSPADDDPPDPEPREAEPD